MADSDPIPACDLIVEAQPLSGRRNMATDAALLQLAPNSERSVVRIYRWVEPTVTLGYFQKHLDDVPEELKGLPTVRRLSGGGAILHDQELTYSCVLPAKHPLRHRPAQAYMVIHRAIIACLQTCGVASSMRSDVARQNVQNQHELAPGQQEPFLCFLRQDGNDVVMPSGEKIIGSAQRRRRGTTLQHGSILLGRSSFTPNVPGIRDLVSGFAESTFVDDLPQAIAGSIGETIKIRSLTASERALAEQIEVESQREITQA